MKIPLCSRRCRLEIRNKLWLRDLVYREFDWRTKISKEIYAKTCQEISDTVALAIPRTDIQRSLRDILFRLPPPWQTARQPHTEKRTMSKKTAKDPLIFLEDLSPDVRDAINEIFKDLLTEHIDATLARVAAKKPTEKITQTLRTTIAEAAWHSVYGQHDANWLAFYRFFHDVCGLVEKTKRLEGLWELCQSAGWGMPYREICWVSERHHILHRDDNEQIHCEDGPAVAYPDGWEIYAIHGVCVPKNVIMEPEKQTIKEIVEEKNEEIKRIRIERFGWPRFLRETNATVVDVRRNDVEQTTESLMKVHGLTVLVCACPSTARVYALEVPPDTNTCEDAQKWLWGNKKINIVGRS